MLSKYPTDKTCFFFKRINPCISIQASPSIVNSSPGAAIPAQDLYQLNQYIQVAIRKPLKKIGLYNTKFQEALAREQFLESKLLSLQRLIGDTEVASSQGWRALMDEDRLLTRWVIPFRGVVAHVLSSELRFWKAS